MTIGNFVGAYFLSLQDVFGRRVVNFAGNAIVIAAGLMQGESRDVVQSIIKKKLLTYGRPRTKPTGLHGRPFHSWIRQRPYEQLSVHGRDRSSSYAWKACRDLRCLLPSRLSRLSRGNERFLAH